MIKKSFLIKNQSYFYIFFLISVSFSVNQYYAFIGVLPVDSFSTFNAAYNILNNSIPFKDFWTIKGPVLDLIQALYFKLFGVSWYSYAAHSSTFNSIFAVSTFLTLKKFNLDDKFCFTYSALASILMYPTYGIPFTDHHASIFSILSVYSLCLAIKTKNNIFWFFLPIFLFLGFFTKQTPSAYFGLLTGIITFFYLFSNFKIKILLSIFLGSILSITLFTIFIIFYKIPYQSIIIQYLLYPMSLGETRLEWLLPLDFQRIVLRHKLIYIALSVPIFLLIRNFYKDFSSVLLKDNLIFILLLGTLFLFITHQLMTINGLFIFFLIPVFSAFSHIYSFNFKKKQRYIIFFLVFSLVSTFYYHEKYISKRDTLILRDVDLNQAVNSKILGQQLENLKWITHHYPKNPKQEIQNLLDSMEIIKNDKKIKMIVTDYQFISSILSIKDNSAARIWWRHHIYPDPGKKYFVYWKNFLLEKIKKEKIEVIYTIHPMEGESNIFEGLVGEECYTNQKINDILVLQILNTCDEFNFLKKQK